MHSWKKGNQTFQNSPEERSLSTLRLWWLATRPKTWIAAVSPIVVAIVSLPRIDLFLLGMTMLFALSIQIGTNLANDYYDSLKGVDTDLRKGPLRVCHQQLISPNSVKWASFLSFSVAALLGVYYQLQMGGWFIPAMASLSIFLGWAYTAGPFPLSHIGVADIAVFWFFGPLATLGVYYLQTHSFAIFPALLGIAPGAVSCAILMVNNIRDIHEDENAGKRTLVVRFGEKFGKISYAILLQIASFSPIALVLAGYLPSYYALISSFSLIGIYLSRKLYQMEPSTAMNQMLAATAIFLWGYTLSIFLLFVL